MIRLNVHIVMQACLDEAHGHCGGPTSKRRISKDCKRLGGSGRCGFEEGVRQSFWCCLRVSSCNQGEVQTSRPSGIGSTPFCQCGRRQDWRSPRLEVVSPDPILVVAKTAGEGQIGKEELSTRFDRFSNGQWDIL